MNPIKKIVFLGAGNVASNLAPFLFQKGFQILQIYSRNAESASFLAKQVNATFTNSLEEIDCFADVYFCCVKDDAITQVLPYLKNTKALVLHTAGSVDVSVFSGICERYGVLYPLQTFSKNKQLDLSNIPIFIEAANPQTLIDVKKIAGTISNNIYEATSSQRKILHLSAVFSCNFTNHLYAISEDLIQKAGFDFSVLTPLIDETATKIHQLKPHQAQTGPAVRFDENVINKHLDMLSEDQMRQQIYRLLSESIHKMQTNTNENEL